MKHELYRVRARTTAAMLTPFLLAFGVFVLAPLVGSIMLSLRRGSGTEPMEFAGLANFRFLLRDRLFWLATLNTTAFTTMFLVIEIPLCLAMAVGLRSRYARSKGAVRFALLCPYFIGPVYASVLFSAMLDARYGVVNRVLSLLVGSEVHIPFLTDPRLSLISMLAVSLWLSIGFGSLYLAAAMQGIPRTLYDAARVDGAGAWACFWHVTLPSVRPMLAILMFVGTIQSFQLFELPYVLFGGPGPSSAGMTVVMYLYGVGFEAGDFAYASAVGWGIVVVVSVLLVLQYAMLHQVLRERPQR